MSSGGETAHLAVQGDAPGDAIVLPQPIDQPQHVITGGLPEGHVVHEGVQRIEEVGPPDRAMMEDDGVDGEELLQLVG